MSSIINGIRVAGNVGKNPEAKKTENGEMMVFSICVNEKYKNKDGEMINKRPLWLNCVCYHPGRVAYLKQHLKEGVFIILDGVLTINSYLSNKYFDSEGNPARMEKPTLVINEFLLFGNTNSSLPPITDESKDNEDLQY